MCSFFIQITITFPAISLHNHRKPELEWQWHGLPNSMVKLPISTVYPKKYAHGFCFAVLCCGYTLTDFPISIRLTSLALWQSNDCPSASKATLMNMDKYFMWIHYERLHNHNKAKHNKTVCIFLGIYCSSFILLERLMSGKSVRCRLMSHGVHTLLLSKQCFNPLNGSNYQLHYYQLIFLNHLHVSK